MSSSTRTAETLVKHLPLVPPRRIFPVAFSSHRHLSPLTSHLSPLTDISPEQQLASLSFPPSLHQPSSFSNSSFSQQTTAASPEHAERAQPFANLVRFPVRTA